jgi:hypothetical protein
MKHDEQLPGTDGGDATGAYRPPTVTVVGTLAELTQKDVGAADGTTFLGLDIGS